MNMRLRFTGIMLLLLLSAAFTVSASGRKEAAQPGPADGTDQAAQVSVQQRDNKPSASSYPPEGWVTDIRDAYRIANEENKQILIDFTGSDWCIWCKKLSAEVFTTDEFKAFADKNLVLLFLDFPNSLQLPDDQVRHNQIIAQLLGVQGYPSIWLMKSDLTPLLVTGYREGGAEDYIRHLKEDRPDVSKDEAENFRLAFTDAIEANIGSLE